MTGNLLSQVPYFFATNIYFQVATLGAILQMSHDFTDWPLNLSQY